MDEKDLKTQQPLFLSLFMFFGFFCLMVGVLACLAGLLGSDLGLGVQKDMSDLHSIMSLLVALIGLALALTINFYLITKFSLWIHSFITKNFVKKDLS